jgi:hypothetical protein
MPKTKMQPDLFLPAGCKRPVSGQVTMDCFAPIISDGTGMSRAPQSSRQMHNRRRVRSGGKQRKKWIGTYALRHGKRRGNLYREANESRGGE